jgi:hypothetical protein
MFVEMGYLCDDLFEMNVTTIVTYNNNNNASYSYLSESYDKWHNRLG